MPVQVVVGAQWGDEGKGGIIDYLAARAQVVARYQGGTNAGRTVVNDLGTFKLHLIPSGILDPKVTCIIGAGVVVNPCELLDEIDLLVSSGVSVDNLYLSDRAQVVMPYHPMIDGLEEDLRGPANLGTTRRGVGPAYADKISREGLRVCELVAPTGLRERIYELVERKNRLIQAYFGGSPIEPGRVYEDYRKFADRLKPHVADTFTMIHQAIDRGDNILCEGAQATLLDIDYGTYPYVTSSSPIAGGACTGLGIGPTRIDRVMGVFKAYITRVGTGPFPTELLGSLGEELRERGAEYGTTTGRARRCGWFDAVVARHAVRVNGMDSAAITKLDVLDDQPTIKLCVGYELDGQRIDYLPSHLPTYAQCEPIWEEHPGWLRPTAEARSLDELPGKARAYLERLSEVIGCPIDLVSVGSHRDQTIVVNHCFS